MQYKETRKAISPTSTLAPNMKYEVVVVLTERTRGGFLAMKRENSRRVIFFVFRFHKLLNWHLSLSTICVCDKNITLYVYDLEKRSKRQKGGSRLNRMIKKIGFQNNNSILYVGLYDSVRGGLLLHHNKKGVLQNGGRIEHLHVD